MECGSNCGRYPRPAGSVHLHRLRSARRRRDTTQWCRSLSAAALDAGGAEIIGEPKTLGLLFESLAIRDLRIYAAAFGGRVSHYRDEQGLEVDAIVEFPDGRSSAVEITLGGTAAIDTAAANMRTLAAKVDDAHRARLAGLAVVTAGTVSVTRDDGVTVVALSHITPFDA